ncbi:AAA family ATPase [Paenibacillus sp. 1011MAR3C5]|uniref:AAA family ATPase n=1 Tax=Paenibacillus sp. 1011MAR3C5 TaxID=1675787 RepID=UPI001604523C|nr:AAA family ATPase [Paenibacillus sp. 1011MAR3C5]
MEILYIWFQKYLQFEQAGFQLSAQHRFHFDHDNGILHVADNPDYQSDFFRLGDPSKPAVVKQITALVGENGTGKTSFLDYIKNVVLNRQEIQQALIVIKDSRERHLIWYDDTVIELKDVQGRKLISPCFESPKILFPGALSESSAIFISNVFDHSYENQAPHYYNLSTNYLIRGDRLKRLEEERFAEDQKEIDVHRDEEIHRQVLFVHKYKAEYHQELPIPLPERLTVSIRDARPDAEIEINKLLGAYAPFYVQFNQWIEQKIADEQARLHKKDITNREKAALKKSIFMYRAYRASVRSLLKELAAFQNDPYLDSIVGLLNLEKVQSQKETIFQFTRRFLQALINRSNEKDHNYWLENIMKVLNFYDSFAGQIEDWTERVFSIPIELGDIEKSRSHQFIQAYRGSYRAYPYLDFGWHNLSSGQTAMLNLFARLFTRVDGQYFGDNEKLSRDVLLLIDEGELYFHPEWQRRFIHDVISYLTIVFPNNRFQIIMTSHSPFLLSDLPSSSVVYLERKNRKLTVEDGLTSGKKTLAANIHDMFSLGFFMGTTVGEFARIKLNQLIQELGNFEKMKKEDFYIPEGTISHLLSTIRSVGEPLVADRLLERYEQLLDDHEPERYALRQIKYWQQELERLRDKEEGRDD